MRLITSLVAITLFCALVVVGYDWVESVDVLPGLAPGQVRSLPWFDVMLLALAMFFGMGASVMVEGLKKRQEPVNLGELVRMLSGARSLVALLISPIVFFVVIKAVGETVDDFADYLLAFQNGFFWEAALAAVAKSTARVPKDMAAS